MLVLMQYNGFIHLGRPVVLFCVKPFRFSSILQALAQVSKTGSASTARGNQIEEMISQTDWARRSIKREESRASIR